MALDEKLTPPIVVGNAIYGCNESLQMLVEHKIIKYRDFMGYASDIGSPMFLTAYAMLATSKKSPAVQKIAALAVPTILTAVEFLTINHKNSTIRFDPYDILCYFGGALLTYAIAKTPMPKKKELTNLTFNPMEVD